MSSLSNTTYNSRSMNGLINVNANTGTFTDLEVNNLIVNQSGTAPTMSSTDNSNRIATTAFVQSHTSGAYVTLNTNQTISGQKTFSNANTYFSGTIADTSYTANKIELDANPSIHQLKVSGNNIYFKATQSVQFDADTGYLTFASPANSYFTNNIGTGKIVQILDTNFTPLSFEVGTGYNYIRSFSPLSLLTSGTNNMNIAPNGNLNLAGSSITISNATSFNSTTTFNTSLPTTTLTPTVSNELVSKAYVDSAISGGLSGYMNLTTAQTANGDKTFNGITTFDNAVIANFQITNNDVASFQNGAFFDNVCPYSTVVATGSQDLVTKGFTETSTQTITGAKTFNNIAINQTTGDVNITLNTSTQKVNIVRGTNTINFSTNAGPALNSSSTSAPFIISAGSGATSAGFTLNPAGGLGEGGEMDVGSTAYFGKNVWIDGTNGGLKSFATNNIRIYNPFSYSYNPSTITWGSPSANTINGWTNSPTNDGQTYTGTASDNSTPANVGQIVLPAPGIWFLQVSALITLNTGSDTITDRTIVVSDVGTTDGTPCTVGFAYRDPIDDGAGSAGNRQQINFSGIYHFVDVSSGTRTLYINAIVITSGTRTVTVSGNYKYTRMG